jgi:Lipase (class 3)
LSEIVYKGQDYGHEAAEQAMRRLESLLPVDVKLSKLQWGRAGKRQIYIVTESTDVLYCAFLGTKSPRDILTSFNYKGNKNYLPELGNSKLHQGYVARAATIPAEGLWRLATARGKRLVFTGHSMGGAIAHLCTLRLLSQLPEDLHHTVRSIGFATPLLGEAAVAEAIAERGWAKALKNYLVPEDWVPNAMNLWQPHVILDAVTHGATNKGASNEAAAGVAAPAGVSTSITIEEDQEHLKPNNSIKRTTTTPVFRNNISTIARAKRSLTQQQPLPQQQQQQQQQQHTVASAVLKVGLPVLKQQVKLNTSTWVVSTLSVLASVLFRAGDLVLLIPRIFAPRYVHLGQQVYLSRRISRENPKYNSTAAAAAAACTSSGSSDSGSYSTTIDGSGPSSGTVTIRTTSGSTDSNTIPSSTDKESKKIAVDNDKLVPLVVKPSLISNHRMITYRLRMIQLYDYQVSTQ